MSDSTRAPKAYVDLVGKSSSEGRRVHIILEYDKTKARIELQVTEPLFGQEPDIEHYRKMLERLGWACREAVLSPQGLSWPSRREET